MAEIQNLPQPLNIFQKINLIMKEVPYIQKEGKAHYVKKDGSSGAKYNFASHDQVVAKLQPAFVKYGIAVCPTVDEIKQEGNRTVVKLMVRIVNIDDVNQVISSVFYGYGIDDGDKGPGKAVSYAFKYALLKTFCLETGDDPDQESESHYAAAKCLEFDSKLPLDFTDKDRAKMKGFLQYSSECMKKDIEDVKREALTRMDEFIAAFNKWGPNKKEKS